MAGLSHRQTEILNIARTTGRVMVEDLVRRFEVSAQTIRKDLNDLCDQRSLTRIHGGAIIASGVENLAYEARRFVAAEEKRAIGELSAEAKRADLLQYCASERYAVLRERMGVAGEELAGLVTLMRDSAEQAGRDPDVLELSLGHLVTKVDADRAGRLADLGADRVVLAMPPVTDIGEAKDMLSACAERLGLSPC